MAILQTSYLTGSVNTHLGWLVNNEINNQQPKSKDLKNFLSLPPLNFSTTVKFSPLGMSSSIYSFSFISLSPRTVASSQNSLLMGRICTLHLSPRIDLITVTSPLTRSLTMFSMISPTFSVTQLQEHMNLLIWFNSPLLWVRSRHPLYSTLSYSLYMTLSKLYYLCPESCRMISFGELTRHYGSMSSQYYPISRNWVKLIDFFWLYSPLIQRKPLWPYSFCSRINRHQMYSPKSSFRQYSLFSLCRRVTLNQAASSTLKTRIDGCSSQKKPSTLYFPAVGRPFRMTVEEQTLYLNGVMRQTDLQISVRAQKVTIFRLNESQGSLQQRVSLQMEYTNEIQPFQPNSSPIAMVSPAFNSFFNRLSAFYVSYSLIFSRLRLLSLLSCIFLLGLPAISSANSIIFPCCRASYFEQQLAQAFSRRNGQISMVRTFISSHHIGKGRLYPSFFGLNDRDIVIDDDVFSYVFLIYLQDIDSVGINSLVFKYFFKESWTTQNAIQSSDKVVFSCCLSS